MSPRRTLVELGVIVSVCGALIAGALSLARWSAERYADSVPVSVDQTIGEQSARIVLSTHASCVDDRAERYVKEIAAPLVRALDEHRFEFRFVVVDDAEVNAFALPGGFVTVNSGLLQAAESGEEVAAVLAHEMQHVVRRHGTRRMLRELGAGALLGAVFGGTDVAVPARIVHDFASTAYDRAEESEADARGLALLVRAGVDPRGMARFFERLARISAAPPALLSTHPDPGDRATRAARAAEGARVTLALPSPKGVLCR